MNQKARSFDRRLFLAYVVCSLGAIFYLPTWSRYLPSRRTHMSLVTTTAPVSCSYYCWWRLDRYGPKG